MFPEFEIRQDNKREPEVQWGWQKNVLWAVPPPFSSGGRFDVLTFLERESEINLHTVGNILIGLRNLAIKNNDLTPTILEDPGIVPILSSDSQDKQQLFNNGLAVGAEMRDDDPNQIAYYRIVLTSNPQHADENTDLIIRLFQARATLEKTYDEEKQDQRLIQAAERLTPEFIEALKNVNKVRAQLENMKREKQLQDINEERALKKRQKVFGRLQYYLSNFAAVWQVPETIDFTDSDLFHQYLSSLTQGIIHPDIDVFEKILEDHYQRAKKVDPTLERSKLDYRKKEFVRFTYYCVEEMLNYENLPQDILEILFNEKLLIDLADPQGLYFAEATESIKKYSPQWLAASTLENKTAELIEKTISAYRQAENKEDRDNLAQAIDHFLTVPHVKVSNDQLTMLLNTFLQRENSTYDLGMIAALFIRQLKHGGTFRKIKEDSELVLSHLQSNEERNVNETGARFIDHVVYDLKLAIQKDDENLRKRGEIYLRFFFNQIIRKYPEYISLNVAEEFIERWPLLKKSSIKPFLSRLTNLLLYKSTYLTRFEADAEKLTIITMFNDKVEWLLRILSKTYMPDEQKRILFNRTIATVLGQNEQEILTYGQDNFPDYTQNTLMNIKRLREIRAEMEVNPLVKQYMN